MTELTPRQIEILRALLNGKRIKEIARELKIRTSSVSMHMTRVRTKTGFRNLMQLGAWCERHGIRESTPNA
jgi:DNA-binding NarL/FixJ family response regulator